MNGQEKSRKNTGINSIELAYAITVRKSQDSQFKRVVVILSGNGRFDRTLDCATVTRAKEEVIIAIDNASHIWNAIKRRPSASERITSFELMFKDNGK